MRRNYHLNEPDFDMPVADIERWSGLNDKGVADQVAFQEQFLQFFRHLLENIQSVPSGSSGFQPTRLSLSVRAGAIKSYVLTAVSIIEGALMCHALKRGLADEDRLKRATYGQLLGIWADDDGDPLPEVAPIWDDLKLLHKYRNYIHLGPASRSPDAYWQAINDREADLLAACDRAIDHLSALDRT